MIRELKVKERTTSDHLKIIHDTEDNSMLVYCVEDNEYTSIVLEGNHFSKLKNWLEDDDSEFIELCEEGQEFHNSVQFNVWGDDKKYISVTCFEEGYEYTVRLNACDLRKELL